MQRFQTEAEAAARLDHPHIVPIYEIGEYEGQHYFSMKLIVGETVATVAASGQSAVDLPERKSTALCRDAATVMGKVARAVHYAHQRGILHRDLKPTNILIDAQGEPHITDFGLAKLIESDADLSKSGAVLGTPSYMAPEQAAGQIKELTIAADIYSLGAILYELLTGQPPFQAEAALEVLRQVCEQEPVRPHILNPQVDRDLETICLKCLSKNPNTRYGSAEMLAEDLDRWRNGEPILARPVSQAERVWRWCRRKPALASAFSGVIVVFALGFAGVLWQWLRAERNADDAIKQSTRAEQNAAAQSAERTRAEDSLRRLEIQRAQELLDQDNAGPALAYLARELRRDPSNHVIASWVMSVLSLRDFRRPRNAPLAHKGPLGQAQFSPDGRWMLTSAEDGTARLWDGGSGKPVGEIMRHRKAARTYAAFSSDGTRVVTAGYDGAARVWEVPSGTPVTPLLEHGAPVHYAEFSPDGTRVVTTTLSDTGGSACVWDARTGAKVTRPLPHDRNVLMARFSPDGERLVTACDDGTARLWDAHTGKPLSDPILFEDGITFVEFSPDGRSLAIASSDRTVRLTDARTGNSLLDPLQHDDPVALVHFSRDGRRLMSAAGQSVYIWDAVTGQLLLKPIRHNSPVSSAQFSPEGIRMVTTCLNRSARVWNSITGEPIGEPMRHYGDIRCADFTPDGAWLVTASGDFTAQLWNLRPRSMLATPMRHSTTVVSLDFSPDGKKLITLGQDGSSRIWESTTGQPLAPMTNYVRRGQSIRFSPDGKRYLITRHYTDALLVDTTSGALPGGPLNHKGTLRFAIFSTDGRFIATGANDGTVSIWNGQTGVLVAAPLPHTNDVPCADFSPDGARLATGDTAGNVRLWDARTGGFIATLASGPTTAIAAIQFSPDGSRLATASFGRNVRIWDTRTTELCAAPLGHDSTITLLQFSRDRRQIYTLTEQGALRAWDVKTGKPLAELIPPNEDVLAAQFSHDGTKMAIVRANYGVRVFDVATGLPLTESLRHSECPMAVKFSPDGMRLAVASGDAARVWELPVVEGPAPNWLPQLAEAVGGWQINSNGVLQAVAVYHIRSRREQVLAITNQDPFTIWGQWYAGNFMTRSIQPGSPTTGDQYIGHCWQEPHPENWRFLRAQQPEVLRSMAGFARTALAQASTRGTMLLTEADYLSSGALALAPDRLDFLDGRVEVNDRLGYEHRYLTQPDAVVQAMAEFRNPRYWLASAWRQASFERWSNALDRCALALSTCSSRREEAHSSSHPAEKDTASSRRLLQRERIVDDDLGPAISFLRAQVLWRLGLPEEARTEHEASRYIPARNPNATAQQLDLTAFYNARLNDDWHVSGNPVLGQRLDALPTGLQTFDGITFDVRALIQLDGSEVRSYGRRYPARVMDVPIGQHCRRVHFLHATVWSGAHGEHLGEYNFHYADGQSAKLPVRYGETLADWWDGPMAIPETGQAYRVAWYGANALARSRNIVQRLYHTVWENPRPDVPLTSLDLTSRGLTATPFIVAITVE